MKKFILILVISSIAYGKDWSELALCINNLIKPTDAVLVKAYGNIQYDLEKALTNSGVKVVNQPIREDINKEKALSQSGLLDTTYKTSLKAISYILEIDIDNKPRLTDMTGVLIPLPDVQCDGHVLHVESSYERLTTPKIINPLIEETESYYGRTQRITKTQALMDETESIIKLYNQLIADSIAKANAPTDSARNADLTWQKNYLNTHYTKPLHYKSSKVSIVHPGRVITGSCALAAGYIFSSAFNSKCSKTGTGYIPVIGAIVSASNLNKEQQGNAPFFYGTGIAQALGVVFILAGTIGNSTVAVTPTVSPVAIGATLTYNIKS